MNDFAHAGNQVHADVWFLITTLTPILKDGANKAASMLTKAVSSGGGLWGKEL
jgi:hypothetical protein